MLRKGILFFVMCLAMGGCASTPSEPNPADQLSGFGTYPSMSCAQLANEESLLLASIEYSQKQAQNSAQTAGMFSMLGAVASGLGYASPSNYGVAQLDAAVAQNGVSAAGTNVQVQGMGQAGFAQRLSVVKSYQRSHNCQA